MPSWDEDRWNRRHELIYSAQLNRLYHQKRERFYALLDRATLAFVLVMGSAAASELLPGPDAKAVAGALVAASTLPGLVFAWADKARLHAGLAVDYALIEADIEAAGVLDWPALDMFSARLLRPGAREPAGLSALLRLCQNELAIAAQQPDRVYPQPWYERGLAHWIDFPKSSA